MNDDGICSEFVEEEEIEEENPFDQIDFSDNDDE